MLKNTFLTRLVLWTIFVTLLSVILVGMIPYYSLQNEIRVNSELYYRQRFEYSCDLIERQFFKPLNSLKSEIIIMRSWDEILREIIEPSSSKMRIVEARETMTKTLRLNENIADMAIYVPDMNFVVSALSGVRYLDSNAAKMPFDLDWLESLPTVSESSKWLAQRTLPSQLMTNNNVISLVMARKIGVKNASPIYICTSIHAEGLHKLFETDDGETFFMVDSEGATTVGSEQLPAALSKANGVQQEGEYVYLLANSGITSWRYVLRVPVSLYTHYGQALRLRVILLCAAIFLIMITISLLVINRMTSPFKAMLERARTLRAQAYKRRRDDLRFVANTFDEYVDYAEAAHKQIEERLEMLKHSFLLALLTNIKPKQEELTDYIQLLKLDAPLPYFTTAILYREEEPFTAVEELNIEARLAECEDDKNHIFSAGVYDNVMYVVVHCVSCEDSEERIRRVIEAPDISPQIYISMGKPVEKLTEIHESLRQAEISRSQALIKNNEKNDDKSHAGQSEQQIALAQQAAKYLSERFAEDISVEIVSEHLNVSRSYLSKVFKEAHGMTILEYLLAVRLSEALRLLDETSLSVTEISERVGFNSSNYFFRKFKEEFGQTPVQYRTEKTK